MTDFTRRSNNAREMERVAIVSVDPTSRTATGVTRIRTTLTINCAYATGDTVTTPAVGEQWYVERLDMEWRLYGRIPFNDATLNIEPEEGQVLVGSASGPLELNGTEIRANGRVLRLNGVYYRDSGETLERSEDGENWYPIFASTDGSGPGGDGGTGGVLQMLANKMADIPVTPEVEDFIADLDDSELQALTDLAEWADGLSTGTGWGLCDNAFFTELQDLGTGDTPLARVGSGLQNLVNTMFRLLFCQYDPEEDGDVTPTVLTGTLTGLSGVFTGENAVGDFLRGLQNLLPSGEQAGNLLLDSVRGAVDFLNDIFDTLFCRPKTITEALAPAEILDKLHQVFNPLRDNPFLQGLRQLVANTAEATGDLIHDAIAGAIKLVRTFFKALFCDWADNNDDDDFTPQVLFDLINDKIIEPLANNPFLTALRDIADKMGVKIGNAITDTVAGATEFLQLVVGVVTCNLTPTQTTKLNTILTTATGGIFPADLLDFLQNRLIQPLQNSFVEGLAQMFRTTSGITRTLLEDAIAGAQQLIEVIYDLLTCNADGDLVADIKLLIGPGAVGITPAKIIGLIDDFFDAFRDNPFLQGLRHFWTTILGNEAKGFAADAVRGAFEFIQYIFDLLFCNANGADEHLDAIRELAGISFTPFKIIKNIVDFFDHFRENVFLTGLQNLLARLGITGDGNLIKDAMTGATEFIKMIFGALTCDGTQLTRLISAIDNTISPGSDGPLNILASLKETITGLLSNTWIQIFNNIANRQGIVGNLITKIVQSVSNITDFFFDILEKIFPAIDFRSIITNFPDGFPTAFPTLAEWLDNFKLADLLDPTQLVTWFRDNVFRPVLKAITGLTDAALDLITNPLEKIGTFFTNVRKFFGEGIIGNFLENFGGGLLNIDFNPLEALESFIDNVLIGGIGKLWDALIDGLTTTANRLVRALTGQTLDGPLGPGLQAIRDFFSGFGEFNPLTGENSLINQIVKRITGDDDKLTLSDLANFFNPTFATNIFKDVVEAITTNTTAFLSGPIKTLADFFDFNKSSIGGGLPTLLHTIVDTMTNSTVLSGTGPLAKLSQLFSGVTLTGGKSLLAQLSDRVTAFGASLGVKSIVSSILGVGQEELDNSYYLTVTGSPTGGTFTLSYGTVSTAAISYSSTAATTAANIDAALAALTPTGASEPLGVDKVAVTSTTLAGGDVRYTVSILDDTATLTVASSSLTGGTSPSIAVVQKFRGPLETLSSFFSGFGEFDGTTTTGGTSLLQQVLTQAGSNIAAVVSKITGIAESLLTTPLDTLGNFFAGFDVFSGTNTLASQLVSRITGGVTGTLANLTQFFTNLRGLFGTTDFLLGTGSFSQGFAANQFITNVLSKASAGLSNLIPAHALANLGIEKITDLVKLITGVDPATGQHTNVLQTFFAGLTGLNAGITRTANSLVSQIANAITGKTGGNPLSDIKSFLGIGTAGGLLDFSGANTIPVVNQIVKAITGRTGTSHPLADIASFFGIGPDTDVTTLNPWTGTTGTTFLNQLIKKIVPSATGLDQMERFFTNLRGLFGLSDSDFLAATSFKFADVATHFVNNVLSKAGTNPLVAITAKIPATILSNLGIGQVDNLIRFLTGKDPAAGTNPGTPTDIETMFTNLRSLFTPAGGSNPLLAGTGGSFPIITAANTFITNLLGQATATIKEALIPDLPLARITGLVTSLADRPVLTTLRTWLTNADAAASEPIQRFFTNLQSVLGGPVLLPASGTFTTTERDNARTLLHNVVKGINDLQGETARWATQSITTALDTTKAGISDLVQRITGATGATTLAGIATLFSPLHATTGTTLLDKLATVITNGTTTLGDFFAGLGGGTATVNSLVHRIVSSITGGAGVQTLASLGTFFGNFTSTATTLVGKVVDHLTGLITNGLSGMTLTNFFSGFNTAATVTGSLAHQIAQSVSGGLATTLTQVTNFFDNLRSFLGIGTTGITLADFLSAPATFATKLTGIINAFITNVLQRTGLSTTLVTLTAGATRLANDLIPDLPMERITNLIGSLTGGTGSSSSDVVNFFANLRSFLGGGNGFLSAAGTFNLATVTENFINNVLRGNGVTTRLVSLASGLNTIAADIVPALEIGKITNLIGYITGSGAEAADIQKFFTNLRGMFGSTNFLTAAGSFSPVTAANQFIVNVLSKATQAGIGVNRIAAEVLADFSVDKVVNLARVLTGQALPVGVTASGDLAVVQRFFSGFTGFDPATGANNLVNQITNAVFGANGTLANLRSFFSGFIPGSGAFNPADGTNNLANQIVRAVTGRTGPLADILSFLGVGAVGDATTFDPFTGANSFLSQLVAKITGGAGTNLTHLANLFANLRTALGLTGIDLHSIAQSAETLRTQVFNVIRDFNAGLNTFISQDKLKEWLGGSATLTQMGNFFANLKTFFGGTAEGSIDLLSGPITFATAVNSFITGILNKGTAGLFNVNLLPTLDITKIGSLVNYITGKNGTVAAADVDVFFGNLRRMLNHGTDAGQINFNTTQTAADLRGTLFNIVTAVNAGLAGTVNALVTGSNLTSWLGAGTVADIKTFFDNLKSLLGGVNLFGAFNPATEINKLFGVLNSATTGALNPLRVLGVGGTGTLSTDLGDRPVLSALTTWLTTSGTANDIQRFITNLRSAVGLSGVNLLAGFDATAAQTALYNVVTGINNTAGALAKQADMALKAGITEVVKAITGGSATTYGDLSAVTSYFGGLSSMTGSTLLAKITNAITGGVDLATFFANLRNFFTGGGVNFGAGSFDPVGAVNAFTKRLLDGSDLMSKLNSYSLTIAGVPTGGSYRLTYAGQTTAAISYDATATTIQAALAALSSIGAGNVTVTGSLGAGFSIAINNLSGTLGTTSVALTGGVNPRVSVSRRIDAGIIPRLGVDWIRDIDDWVQGNFVSPIVSTLITATGIDPTKFGIDLSQVGTSLASGLTALGTWASNLLTGVSRIPAGNLFGSISDALLGVIPVANISNVSPNLIAQGDFAAATTINPSGGWSWDDQNNRTGTGGSAKLTVTAAGTQELFARQSVPVAKDDKLTMSAYVKASGVTGGQASYTVIITGSPTGGTFRLTYGGQTTSSLAYNAPPAVVQEALGLLPTIGAGNVTVTGTAGVSYTAVINNLTGSLTASSAFVGPRSYNLDITGSPSSGTFTLSYNGSTTTELARDASASTIQAALTALPSVGAGRATVSGSGSSFAVTVAPTAPATLGVSSTLTLRTHTLNLTNNPTGGTYTLTYGAESTTPLAYNATPAQVAAALTALAGVETATVTGAGGTSALPYTIVLDNQNSTLSTTSSLVSGLAPTFGVTAGTASTRYASTVYSQSSLYSANNVATYQYMNNGSADGSTSASNNQTGTNNGTNEWIKADVGATRSISHIVIGYDYLNNLPGGWGVVNYASGQVVQGSTDNTNWTTISSVPTYAATGSTNGLATIPINGNWRYIRVQRNGFLCLLEFQVWVNGGTGQGYTVTLGNTPTGGTFRLTYNGQTTTDLAYNATPAAVQAALGALSSIGAGNVSVAGVAGSSYSVYLAVTSSTLTGSSALTNGNSSASTVSSSTSAVIAAKTTGRYTVAVSGSPTAGTYTLGYGGQTTAPLAHNADAATVQAALAALSSIGAGNVSVTALSASSYTVDVANYTGSLSLVGNSLVSAANAAVTVTDNFRPATGTSVYTTTAGEANGGALTLSYGGASVAVPPTATAAQVAAALTGLSSVSTAAVTGSSGTAFTITLGNSKRTLSAADTFLSSSSTTPDAVITETTGLAAVAGGSYTVAVTGSPSGGTYTLGYNGETTTALARNATPATVQAALSALPGLGAGKVGVVGSATAYTVAVADEASTLTVPGTALTGGTAPKVTVTDTARPVALTLIPFTGTTQLSPIPMATARPGAAWTQVTGTVTMPAGVTSVIARIAHGGAATAAEVWFDDISLTKVGLLQQGLVDRLMDAWEGLWDGVFGSGGLGKLSDSVREALGFLTFRANAGLTNAAIADGKAGTAQTTADDAQKLSVKNAAELTKLQASQTAIGTGLQNFENFDYNSTTLLATKWSTVTESPNAGYYRTDGSRAYWADQGGSANTWWGRFLTPTNTPFQNVSVVLDSPLTESPILGSGEAYLYLLGRADATMSNYVYARIGVNTLSVWKKVAGYSPIQVGNAINYTVRVGDTVTFVCGTGVESSKIRQFQIIVNGIKQLDFTDSTFYGNVLSVMSTLADTTNPNPPQTNNFGGFGGYSAPRPGGGQSTPGAVSIFSISDNPVTPTVGSGIRVYRSNSAVRGSISSGDNIFPLGWFGAVDRITPDLTYDSQTGRVTVSVEGWYQCTIAQHGDSSIGPGGGGAARAMLWKGSGTGARQAVAIGPGFAWNINVGFSGFGGDFQVYLKAGEWVEPGYSCNAAGSNLLIADAAGLRTWFSMSLTNRSYA